MTRPPPAGVAADWRIGTEHEKFGFELDTLRPPVDSGRGAAALPSVVVKAWAVLPLALAALSLGSADAGRLKVMVSFHPLYDVVARVAGGAAEVQRAAPAGCASRGPAMTG